MISICFIWFSLISFHFILFLILILLFSHFHDFHYTDCFYDVLSLFMHVMLFYYIKILFVFNDFIWLFHHIDLAYFHDFLWLYMIFVFQWYNDFLRFVMISMRQIVMNVYFQWFWCFSSHICFHDDLFYFLCFIT